MAVKFSEFTIGTINADLEIVGFNSATPANVQVSYTDIKTDILAGAITGTVAIGQVPFGSAANTVSGSNNLFWDAANNNLGIGTTAPIGKLDIVSDGGGQMFFTRYGGQPQINIRRSQGTFAVPVAVSSGASSLLNFQNYNGTSFAASAQIQVVPTTQTLTDAGATMALNVVRNGTTTMTNGLLVSGANATTGAISITNGFNGPSARLTIWGSTINTTLDYFDIVTSGGGQLLRFFNTGNLVVGSGSDAGQRLQVYGNTLLRGATSTSADNALLITNSGGGGLFSVRNDGYTEVAGNFKLSGIGFFGNVQLYPSINGGYIPSQVGAALRYETSFNVGISSPFAYAYNLFSAELGTATDITNTAFGGVFSPTSGTKTFSLISISAVINQTGGANGITRALYINPTLTAAADWRAIEITAGVSVFAPSSTASATLRIPSGTAPTTPVNGDVWSDGTNLFTRIGGVTKTFTLI